VIAASAVGCGLRTAATSDLWKDVPVTKVDGGEITDRATPNGGIAPPPGCVVDPATVAPMESLDVAEGEFAMGCNAAVDDECHADENPQHNVSIRPFAVDKTEVTQAEYAVCLQNGQCTKPYCKWDPCAAPTLPIACVSYEQAQRYCASIGKRLPTEAEWEKAARGTDGRKYPWGNDPPDCDKTNMDGCGGPKPVASVPAGASAYGALDMAGNVVEWVSDVYDEAYYASSPPSDPTGPAPAPTAKHGGRGGGWRSIGFWSRASTRDFYEFDYVKDSLGFRCVK
jgi:formylglycine-generating enzyme required for sulfatase activity